MLITPEFYKRPRRSQPAPRLQRSITRHLTCTMKARAHAAGWVVIALWHALANRWSDDPVPLVRLPDKAFCATMAVWATLCV